MEFITHPAEIDGRLQAVGQMPGGVDTLRRELAKFSLRSALSTKLRKLAPDSPAYRDLCLEMFQSIRESGHAVHDEGLQETDVEHKVRWPAPFGQSAHSVGSYLIAFGFIIKTMDLPLGAKILEVGCGSGAFSQVLARMGYDLHALDVSGSCVEVTQRLLDEVADTVKARAQQGSFLDLPLQEKSYDAVIFFETFHHFLDHRAALEKTKRLLKDGGVLVLAGEPIFRKQNDQLPYPWGLRLDGESLRAIRKFGWMELGFTRKYLRSILSAVGFHSVRFRLHESHWSEVVVAFSRTSPAHSLKKWVKRKWVVRYRGVKTVLMR